MSDKAVKGARDFGTASSPFNMINFLIDMKLNSINTALPVIVEEADASGTEAVGYVSVKPLIAQTDAKGNALEVPVISKLPYFRYQGGKAAVIIDPQKGDIGLAVFSQADASGIKSGQSESVVPGSFRSFSLSDGFFIGGFLDKAPEVWLEMKEGSAVLHTTEKITLEAKDIGITFDEGFSAEGKEITLKASSSIALDSGDVGLGGSPSSPVTKGDELLKYLKQIVELIKTHTHPGVMPGPGDTGPSVALSTGLLPPQDSINSTKVKVG